MPSMPRTPKVDETRASSGRNLAVTKEKLRVTEEVVLTMRVDFGQSSQTLLEVKTRCRSLPSESSRRSL
jgi:hypothetical protein